MGKLRRKWIELTYANTGSLRAEDIPYSDTLSIKQKIDEIAAFLSTDDNFILSDDDDNTKQIRFECETVTSGNLRIITAPDEDIDLGWLPKLLPAKPANLSTKTLSIPGTYSASQSGTGTVHATTIDSQIPQTSTVEDFYNGDAGTLSCEIDSVADGSKALTTGSDVGTYTSLIITVDEDPYAGQAQKAGFYKQLSAYVKAAAALNYTQAHTYQMKHSLTGDTNSLSFWCDDPGTTTVSDRSFTLPGSNTRYVSGVPSLATGDTIACHFTVNNAVRKHYNSTKLASLSGNEVATVNVAPPITPPNESDSVPYTDKNVTIATNKYNENVSVTFQGFNSKGTGGTTASNNTGARVDTVSDESARKISGSGQYPASGYGGSFVSTTSLKDTYTEELQMLNGRYQRPAGNYSSNLPTAGPDYSSGMGTDYRYVTFQPTSLSNNARFTVTFNGTQGTWSGINTTGLRIYAKVEGVTGWIDCNASYPGVGSPSADGDAAMVYADSSATVKVVTLGSTVRTGNLYIRIGLPDGSDKKFTGVTVSNLQ